MSSKILGLSCLAGLALWLAPGCQICGDGAICRDTSENAKGSALCQSFCSRLADCDDLGGTSESDCIASCDDQCSHGAAANKGAQCVVEASCSAIHSEACSGAPFPSGGGVTVGVSVGASSTGSSGYGGQSTTSSSGGAGGAATSTSSTSSGQTTSSSSSSTSGGPIACVANCDCPSGDVCYQGFCAVYKP